MPIPLSFWNQVVVSGWTPQSAANLVAWWDGPNLGLANGATVSSFTDKKTGGIYTLTPSAGDVAPTYVTAARNGLAAVDFVAASTHCLSVNGPTMSSYPRAFWAVMKYTGTGIMSILGSTDGANQGNGGLHWYIDQSTGLMGVTSQNTSAIGLQVGGALVSGTWYLVQLTMTSTTYEFKVDGTIRGSGAHAVGLSASKTLSLGGIHQGSSISAVGLTGQIGEAGAVTSWAGGEEANLHTYAQGRWLTT